MITINVIESKYELLLPKAFSPNGDNVNDLFRIVNESDFESIHLQKYNRWGALIYSGFNGIRVGMINIEEKSKLL